MVSLFLIVFIYILELSIWSAELRSKIWKNGSGITRNASVKVTGPKC